MKVKENIETLAKKFHQVYCRELDRQGRNNIHPRAYKDLSEDIKDLDRALAKYVLNELSLAEKRGYEKAIKNCLKVIPKGEDTHSMINVWQLREHIKVLEKEIK